MVSSLLRLSAIVLSQALIAPLTPIPALVRRISDPEGGTVLERPGSLMVLRQRCCIQNPAEQCVQQRIGNPDAVKIHLYGAALGVLRVQATVTWSLWAAQGVAPGAQRAHL